MPRYRTRFEKQAEELLNENLPIDVLPYSNCEHFPDEPTEKERLIMKVADEQVEHWRRKWGMSRREFVRTSAAFSICLWASRVVNNSYAGESVPSIPHDPRWDACQLDFLDPGDVSLQNKPGEFVFDVQSHHVTSEDKWRVLQPVHHAFICVFPFGVGSQGNKQGGFAERTNVDPCENVGRWAYIKDIYLDSATSAGVLSPVPSAPDEQQPLPFDEANETAHIMENLAGNTMRTVTHGYVMPNRGWVRERTDEGPIFVPNPLGAPHVYDCKDTNEACSLSTPSTGTPIFMQDELDWMEERALKYRRYLRGWKVYTPYGDVPFTSGMAHDDVAGFAMNDKIRELHKKYGVPKVLASHKGVPLPTFDARRQACDDVPHAAASYPDIRFIIYHAAGSGGGSHANAYPTDLYAQRKPPTTHATEDDINIADMNTGLDGLIKSLRLYGNGDLTAQRTSVAPVLLTDNEGNPVEPYFPAEPMPSDLAHWNTVNVGVDLGSQIRTGATVDQALFYAKMCHWLGPRRICYGTDSIWGGSSHSEIVFLRTLLTAEDANTPFLENGDDNPLFYIAQDYNLPWGLDGDRYDPRVNALTGEVAGGTPGVNEGYTQAYLDAHPSLKDPRIGGAGSHKWPTSLAPHPQVKANYDAQSSTARAAFGEFVSGHPERSIRNGILGRNAADMYEHDPDARYEAIVCDDLQQLRDHYIGDKLAGGWEMHRWRTNEIYGPRTKRELIDKLNDEWAKHGWRA